MADYISREAALNLIDRYWQQAYNAHFLDAAVRLGSVYREMEDLPAADVREVKRGKWEQVTQPCGWRDYECAECSVCGEDFVLDEWGMDDFTNLMNFCPNCGAEMKGEASDV